MGIGRRSKAALAAALLAVAAAGCTSMGEPTDAASGAVAGGLFGGFAGSAIGRHNGHGTTGTLAGAGLGALVGGLAGALSDARKDTYVPRSRGFEEAPPAGTGDDLPPIPRPQPMRVVRRTTVVRREPVFVEPCRTTVVERRYYYYDDD